MNKLLELALKIKASVTGQQGLTQLTTDVGEFGNTVDSVDPKAQALTEEIKKLGEQDQAISAFKQQKTATLAAEKQWQSAQLRIQELAKQLAASEGPSKTLTNEFERSKKAANRAKTAYQQQNQTLEQQRRALSAVGISSKALSAAQSNAKQKAQQLQTELKQLNATAKQQRRDFDFSSQSFDTFKGKVSNTTSKIVALAGAYLGINTLKSSLVSLFTTGDKFERLDTQLTAIMGSIEGGEKASAWIKDFAKNTPLQLEEVTQVFVKMKAMGLDPMDGSMQSLVDQTFKMGGGFQELQGISLALGQAWSKQKLQAEEINQLIERGVPVWQLLADATGKNTAELQQLSTAGELGRDTIKALMDEMAAQSQGAAAANMSLLSGLISNARDNLSQFYNMVSQSGALDWLKTQLQYVNDEFSRMANSGELQQWAKRVSDGIIKIGEALKSGITNLIAWKDEIFLLGKAWAGLKLLTWVGQLKNLVLQLRATAVSTASAATKVKVFGVSMSSASAAVRTLGAALKGVLVVAAIESIAKIVELVEVTHDLVKAKRALAESEKDAAEESAQAKLAYQLLSEQLGITITDMDQLHQLLRGGDYVSTETGIKRTAEALGELSTRLGISITSTEQYQQLIKDGSLVFDDWIGRYRLSAEAVRQQSTETQIAADNMSVFAEAAERSKNEHAGLLEQLIKQTEANAALGGALESLGLNYDLLEGRARESFSKIENSLQILQTATSVSSETIAAALKKAFDQAQNKAELAIVNASLEEFKKQGKLTGEALTEVMTAAAKKTQELTESINQLSAAEKERYIEQQTVALRDQIATLEAKRQAILANKEAGAITEQEYIKGLAAIDTQIGIVVSQINTLGESFSEQAAPVEGASTSMQKTIDDLKKRIQTLKGELADTAQSHQEVGEAAEQASEYVSRGSENATQSVRAQKDAVDFLSLTWEEMGEKVDELQNRIRHNSMRQGRINENLLDAMAKQQVEYDKHTLAIAGQAKAYRHIEDAINSTEQPSLQFLDRAKKSVAAMDLLDKSKLSALNNQIDSASRKLQNLRDSAKSALASVQDELDQLNGNDDAIAQRRQEQALSQLKEQLEQAELAKDAQAISDLKDAIKLQQQLYKQQQAQAKTEQQITTQSNDVATTQTTNTTPSVASNSTVKALRLELALPSGGVIQSDVYDAVSQRLLDELEQIKATS